MQDQRMLQHALDLLPCAEVQLERRRGDQISKQAVLERIDVELNEGALTPQRRAELVSLREGFVGTIQENRDAIATCDAIPEADRGQGLALLQRAAESGVPGARVAYARNALGDYVTATDVLANIDEARRRRDLVQRFLAEAVAQCDADAWSARFDLRDVTAGGPRDAATQVAIIQAYYAAQLAAGEEAARLQHVHDTLDAAANGLDAASRERAVRQGEAEVARCAASFH